MTKVRKQYTDEERDIGIVDEGRAGYNPTSICPMVNTEFTYDQLQEECNWININVLGWTKREAEEIVASSFVAQNKKNKERNITKEIIDIIVDDYDFLPTEDEREDLQNHIESILVEEYGTNMEE